MANFLTINSSIDNLRWSKAGQVTVPHSLAWTEEEGEIPCSQDLGKIDKNRDQTAHQVTHFIHLGSQSPLWFFSSGSSGPTTLF